ncbi:MAG: D-alanine--D-alanine ligase [Clostridia bacterium]|nr:D-alanine--D-alanine ligase [Clostridia bacterium]
MKKLDLILLFGGRSSEHEVSCRSACAVLAHLDAEKYNVRTVGITKAGKWYLYSGDPAKIADGTWEKDWNFLLPAMPDVATQTGRFYGIQGASLWAIPCDLVFPVLHGAEGEDGRIQGMLDVARIPYVGCGCAASAVSMDKALTKSIINNTDVPQVPCLIVSAADDVQEVAARVEAKFTYPVFVKPANAGSSVGASKAEDRDGLLRALALAAKEDKKILVEEFVRCREVEVAVMGNESPVASRTGEIAPGSDFYDYDTKYKNDTASYYIPARISEEMQEQIRAWAVTVYRALGCRGLSRVDFFVRDDREIFFNEINTLPGFTSISMYPKLWMDAGLTFSEILDRLIALAQEG